MPAAWSRRFPLKPQILGPKIVGAAVVAPVGTYLNVYPRVAIPRGGVFPLRPLVLGPKLFVPIGTYLNVRPRVAIPRGGGFPLQAQVLGPLLFVPIGTFLWSKPQKGPLPYQRFPLKPLIKGLLSYPASAANAQYIVFPYRISGVLYEHLVPLHNLQSDSDPGSSHDASTGYSPGSMWVNKTGGRVWVATRTTIGAAVWIQVG